MENRLDLHSGSLESHAFGGTRSQPGHIVSVAKLDYRENISHALGLETQ